MPSEQSPKGSSTLSTGPHRESEILSQGAEVDTSVTVSEDTYKQMLEDCFPESESSVIVIHNHNKCRQTNCNGLTLKHEGQKLQKYKFNHQWLHDSKLTFCEKTGIYWLVYKEQCAESQEKDGNDAGMFCLLCRKHNTENIKNKSKVYNKTAATRFRKIAIEDHGKSKQHRDAVTAELLSRVSIFANETKKQKQVKNQVLFNAFASCYFLAKEEISNKKLLNLIALLEFLGDSDMKYFQHRSEASIRQIFSELAKVIKDEVIEKVNRAGTYGILTDDATDIAVLEQMVTFISYVNDGGFPEVNFLSIADVLSKGQSPNSETLEKVLVEEIEDNCHLSLQNMSSLVTDGAAVMVGKNNGLAAKLKKKIPSLISIHCICHRLALACTDSNETSYIKIVETTLQQLWRFFDYSAKKTKQYMNIQLEYKKMKVASEKVKEIICRKIAKSCRTRWLSLDHSVQGIYLDFVPLMQTLKYFKDNDAIASGLLAKMNTVKFCGAVYILKHVLPVLSTLSKSFQSGTINYARLSPAISRAKQELQDLVDSGKVLDDFSNDVKGRLALCEMNPTTHQLQEQSNLLEKYVRALQSNIDRRFSDSLPVVSSFSIFDPRLVPALSSPDFKVYGTNEIQILGKHFYANQDQSEADDLHTPQDRLLTEFANLKYELLEWRDKPEYLAATKKAPPASSGDNTERKKAGQEKTKSVTPSEWVLHRLFSMKTEYSHFYPQLMQIAAISYCMPISNAWPERGVSTMKRVKTRLRSTMKNDLLEALMHISINGPMCTSVEARHIIEKSVSQWCQKPRYKLKNMYTNQNDSVPNAVDVEAEVQSVRISTASGQQSQREVVETQEMGIQVDVSELDEHAAQDIDLQVQFTAVALNLCDEFYDSDSDDSDASP